MIALISGKIAYKGISHVIVDVQGVGYRIFIPLTTFYELPEAGASNNAACPYQRQTGCYKFIWFLHSSGKGSFPIDDLRKRHRTENFHEYPFRNFRHRSCCALYPAAMWESWSTFREWVKKWLSV